MSVSIPRPDYDLENTVADNRLVGLWRMMTGFHRTYLAAALSLGLAAVIKTVSYLLIRYYVDDILGVTSMAQWLPVVAFAFVGLALLEGTFTFLSGRWAARTAEGIVYRLRNYLFDRLQRLPFSYHDKTSTGELIQRSTSDVDALRRFFQDQAVNAGRITLLFLVNFTAIMLIDWRLALFSVMVVPIILAMSVFFFKRIFDAYESYQEQEAVLSTTLQENLSGVRVVKAFARQEYERGKFEKDNWEKFRRGKRLLMIHSAYWPITDILCGLQMVAGFTLAALMTMNGTITVGTYLAYHGLVIWIIWPIRNLGRLIVQMSMGMVSFERVEKIIAEPTEPLTTGDVQPAGPPEGEIIFRDVAFEYEEGTPVLRDISFPCLPGQVVALLGSTGSGKTSLVNLLPRFYEAGSGTIDLDGKPLSDYTREYLRRHIGIVEQDPFLFSRTIRDNITYGVDRDVTDEEVYQAAQAAAVHDVILSFPEGYNTLVGERGVTLSGGQKQRVAIARTLMRNPKILILDDATSSVDTETEASIRHALEHLMEGRTTFVIAHRIQSVMDADLILVMQNGQIMERGTHQALLAEDGIYRRIFELQASIEDELQQELSVSEDGSGNGRGDGTDPNTA
ncbi:MAG: ABC transporter ATP-binding protein [Chloroflexota bacterium]|nr:ABC transporter ATP-binding protein [Chloroflexota bacterium]